MSAISNYKSLDKTSRRFIWVGYIIYTVYIWLLDGFDDVIETITPTDNALVLIIVALGLYWGAIFLFLWATDN